MKASERKILEFFATPNLQFTIPVYQRDYNWQIKNCETLFNDIKNLSRNRNEPSHFIGSIVYIHEGTYQIGTNTLEIIDGQQRMTTLTLLFLALYYRLKELGEEREARKVYNKYIIDEFMDRGVKYNGNPINLKLIPPKENLDILIKLTKTDKENELSDARDKNMVKNFLYFKKRIEDYKFEDIDNFLIGIEKLIYVDIALENGKDDPQRIFESLNSTGLDLSQGDLIRNYILMGLPREEQNRVYNDIWIPIENNCKISDGEKITNYVSDFIRDYLTLKNNKIPTKNMVFEEFKKYYKGVDNLSEMKEYSGAYAIIRKPELENDKMLQKHFEYLKILDQTVINPFLIGVIKDYREEKINSEEMKEILEILQSYLWRRYITEEPSNALNKIFESLYPKVSGEEKYSKTLLDILLIQKFPTDEELKCNLKTKLVYKNKEKLRYVFERLENHSHNELIDFSNDKITIEHIFPQKPSSEWKEKYSEKELEEMMNYKDTISNLTLTGSNSNLSNKSFIEKRDDPQHGYKNSKLFLNKYLGEQDEWNTLKMEERYEILFKEIIKIWKRPKIEKEKAEEIIFVLSGKTGSGQGKLYKNKKFEVLKGSYISKEFSDSIKEKFKKTINELLEKNILEEQEKAYFVKEDFETSPSTGASLILGRSANGWKEWKTYSGVTMNEFKSKNDKEEN